MFRTHAWHLTSMKGSGYYSLPDSMHTHHVVFRTHAWHMKSMPGSKLLLFHALQYAHASCLYSGTMLDIWHQCWAVAIIPCHAVCPGTCYCSLPYSIHMHHVVFRTHTWHTTSISANGYIPCPAVWACIICIQIWEPVLDTWHQCQAVAIVLCSTVYPCIMLCSRPSSQKLYNKTNVICTIDNFQNIMSLKVVALNKTYTVGILYKKTITLWQLIRIFKF